MEAINVKVTMRAKNFELSLTEDYTEYAEELIECNNVFTSTNIKMTEENIRDYFKEGTFTWEEIDALNGDHFIYGFVERISQDYRYSDLLAEYDDITFTVTLV